MTPEALLERLGELGVAVRLRGPGRIAPAPPGLIPDELRPEVVAHKAKLAFILEPRRPGSARPPDQVRPELLAPEEVGS